MYEKLRHLQVDRLELDEAVAVAAFGRAVKAEFGQHGLDTPDWLRDALEGLTREIELRREDYLRKQIREDETRLEAMAPAEEKRHALRNRIARNKKILGGRAK